MILNNSYYISISLIPLNAFDVVRVTKINRQIETLDKKSNIYYFVDF
jgi:hypothetical protein